MQVVGKAGKDNVDEDKRPQDCGQNCSQRAAADEDTVCQKDGMEVGDLARIGRQSEDVDEAEKGRDGVRADGEDEEALMLGWEIVQCFAYA